MPVQESKKSLIDKVYSLQETGATALGPALAYAVAMASNCPGSKIMVCTDGLANVGIGNLEEVQNLRSSGESFGEENDEVS